MSDTHRRRILRRTEGFNEVAHSAALLVDVPVGMRDTGGHGLQEMLDQARREGHDEGYRAATAELAAAEASGRSAQLRRMADALVAAAALIHDTRRQLTDEAAADAAQLAYSLTEAFLQRELAVQESVVDGVARALSLIPEEQDVIVRLNPIDLVDPSELQTLVPDASVKVLADPRIEIGGCVIVAGPCRIDTQVGPALERARRVLDEMYPAKAAVA